MSLNAAVRFVELVQEIIDHIERWQEDDLASWGIGWWGTEVQEAADEADALRERLGIGDTPVLMIVHRLEGWRDRRAIAYGVDLPPGDNDTLAICGTPGGEVAALVLQTEDDFEPDGWPIVRPDAGETARAVVETLRQWMDVAGRQSVPCEATSCQEVREYLDRCRLRGEPWTSLRDVARRIKDEYGTTCSTATVHKAINEGSIELQEWTERPAGPRTMMPFDGAALDITADPREPNPADIDEPADIRAVLDFARDMADPEEVARINKMAPSEKRRFAELVCRDPDRDEQVSRYRSRVN